MASLLRNAPQVTRAQRKAALTVQKKPRAGRIQHERGPDPPVVDSPVESVVPLVVDHGRVGSLLKQEQNDKEVSVLRRPDQRGKVPIIRRVLLGTNLEQERHCLHVTFERCPVQGGVTVVSSHIHVGLVPRERRDDVAPGSQLPTQGFVHGAQGLGFGVQGSVFTVHGSRCGIRMTV
jgi:hypothetical protein